MLTLTIVILASLATGLGFLLTESSNQTWIEDANCTSCNNGRQCANDSGCSYFDFCKDKLCGNPCNFKTCHPNSACEGWNHKARCGCSDLSRTYTGDTEGCVARPPKTDETINETNYCEAMDQHGHNWRVELNHLGRGPCPKGWIGEAVWACPNSSNYFREFPRFPTPSPDYSLCNGSTMTTEVESSILMMALLLLLNIFF